MSALLPTQLQKAYETRFAGLTNYRRRVWEVLCGFFSKWIPPNATVLDLGSGYCEFINSVQAQRKYAMDLNPDIDTLAAPDVVALRQDCSAEWALSPEILDAVFTSNFFEHLPSKAALQATLQHAWRCLRPGGRMIMMGPNIKYIPGKYWDFFDHYIPLTELSLAEALRMCGFEIETCVGRFLPYTMSQGRIYPVWMLRFYLAMPWTWPIFGKQFLVVARKN